MADVSNNMKRISGVDGCKGEWIAFHFDGILWSGKLFKNISELYAEADAELILIDIPIGLRENEASERLCDLQARAVLDKRKSSVFPSPSRAALFCEDYSQASRKNQESSGRGLSKQSFSIIPKIREVDVFVQSADYFPKKKRIREVHPEICFWGLNRRSEMNYYKNDTLGKCERLEVLNQYIKDAKKIFDAVRIRYKKQYVADSDIIDAMGCAVTAIFNDSLSTFPPKPEKDSKGLSMEIVYYSSNQRLERGVR